MWAAPAVILLARKPARKKKKVPLWTPFMSRKESGKLVFLTIYTPNSD